MAQHPLFDQVPTLRHDIDIPDYCVLSLSADAAGTDDEVAINAWFGPGGTVSCLHHDPKHNLLCQVRWLAGRQCMRCVSVCVTPGWLSAGAAQVVGRKRITMYHARHSAAMYPHTGMMSNTSQVDAEAPDGDAFPLFLKAPFWQCELSAGEMFVCLPRRHSLRFASLGWPASPHRLYIPPKFWHHVRSLETSFSVSFWWE